MTLSATLAWRYLIGRGARSLLTTLAVALGVMLTFGLNGITPALEAAFTRSLLSSAGQIDLTVTDSYNQSFPATVADRVAAVPGVAAVSPETQRTAPLPPSPDPGPDDVTQLTVIGIDPSRAAKVRDFPLAAGRMLTSGDGFALVLPGDLAARMGVGVGDAIVLPSALGTARFKVVGLLSSASVPGESQVSCRWPLPSRCSRWAAGSPCCRPPSPPTPTGPRPSRRWPPPSAPTSRSVVCRARLG